MNDESEASRLRGLLSRMRDEYAEAWRVRDPKKATAAHVHHDSTLLAEVEDELGPDAWDSMQPAVHIEWGSQAICHWTMHPMKVWPASQTTVHITKLITKHDDEFVAHPAADWQGVTCLKCQARLPTLARELGDTGREIVNGIMEGYRNHPDTIAATEWWRNNGKKP